MYSYQDQLEIVKSIKLSEGDRKTLDCPFCGGKKKFTIDKFDGKLVWNCYKASCTVKGAYSGKRSIEATKAYLANKAVERKKSRYLPIPSIVTKVENHIPALEYLKSVNSLEAYQRGYIKLAYAPKENRVLFYNKTGTGAVGRLLDGSAAKWWSYGNLEGGITVGKGDHAVLVEDVPSACSVSRIEGIQGYALLGTNITKPIRKTLSKYKFSTLVLDKDASLKAIRETRCNRYVTHLRFTNRDLKILNEDQIRNILR